jgi:hypothetical protein
MRWNRAVDHTPGSDYTALSNARAFEDLAPFANPDMRSDDDIIIVVEALSARPVIDAVTIGAAHHDVGGKHAIFSNLDGASIAGINGHVAAKGRFSSNPQLGLVPHPQDYANGTA